MARYLAGVLSVIAVGVLMIAYGLLNPRAAAADASGLPHPMYASDRVTVLPGPDDNPYVMRQLAQPVAATRTVYAPDDTYAAPRRAVVSRPVSYQERPARVVRSGRDWKKTAMVVGGSTAAGAGLGAIFGGKKGALIGAAIGGGAGTLYEVRKR